jgi:RsiW-degrading membrane proteinase PrsW (M82 family)
MISQLLKPHVFTLLSFIIGVLCVVYIRAKDRFEKEPFGHLLAVTIWGGMWSYIISGLLYEQLARWGIFNLENTWGALLVIGPVEEGSKLAALFSSYLIIRKQLNEPVDGLLYMACVALGYSLIENYYYAVQMPQESARLFMARLLICTPMHINFSAFMGLAFYFFTRHRRAYGLLILSLAYAAVVHGLYDLIVFNSYFILLLALVVWLAYKWAVSLLGYATAKSQFRPSLWSFIATYPAAYLMPGLTCPDCGSTADKPTYLLLARTIQKCDRCEAYITTPAGLRTILHHFAAEPARNFWGRPVVGRRPHGSKSIAPPVRKSHDGRTLSFDLQSLNNLIVQRNRHTIRRMEARWWFPRRLIDK